MEILRESLDLLYPRVMSMSGEEKRAISNTSIMHRKGLGSAILCNNEISSADDLNVLFIFLGCLSVCKYVLHSCECNISGTLYGIYFSLSKMSTGKLRN